MLYFNNMSLGSFLKDLIKNLFFVRTWTYSTLAQNVKYYRKYNVLPDSLSLPDYLEFPYSFWQRVKDLRRYTDNDGHEYASSVYVIDNDIILTPFIRGEPHQVNIKYNIKWHYEPVDSARYVKKVYVNNEKVLEKTVYKYQIPKKLYSIYLFSIHTHPYHADIGRYGYYSNQDMSSLVNSSAIAIGLITDKFNLVFKTNKSPKIWTKQDNINISLLKNLGFAVYQAGFGKKLEKL